MRKSEARKLLVKSEACIAALRRQAAELSEIIASPPERTRHPGPPKFGATSQEAALVERVKELREAGATYAGIVAALNDEGYRTRRGGLWHIQGVQRIFVNQEERNAA